MPRFLNTDNGRVLNVTDKEAFIYERASNFVLVDEAEASAAGAALQRHKAEDAAASEAGRELEAHQQQTKPPAPPHTTGAHKAGPPAKKATPTPKRKA